MTRIRINYLDNLKIFLICLVIAYHTAHAYGPIQGEWYLHNNILANWLNKFIAIDSSFFMALFFMISGYFVPQSYDKHGSKKFALSKVKHLFIPVVILLVLIVPIYFFASYNYNAIVKVNFIYYYINIYWKGFEFSYAHGWFILHLFIYSMIYLLIRNLFNKKQLFKVYRVNTINIGYIFIIGLVVAISSYIIRLFYPTNVWILILGIIGTEPAHLTQYVIFFTIGVLAYRNNLFNRIGEKEGLISTIISVIMVIITFLTDIMPKNIYDVFLNNWVWYESFMGIFISISLLYLFRKYFDKTSPFSTMLAQNSFGAYMIHTLYVVLFQIAFSTLSIGPSLKFIIVTSISIICSYFTSYIFRKNSIIKSLV